MPYCVYLSKSFVSGYQLEDGIRVYVKSGVDSNKAIFASAEMALAVASANAQKAPNMCVLHVFAHRQYIIVHQSDWAHKGPKNWEGPLRDFPETVTRNI